MFGTCPGGTKSQTASGPCETITLLDDFHVAGQQFEGFSDMTFATSGLETCQTEDANPWYSLLRTEGSSFNTLAESPAAVQAITAASSFTLSDIIGAVMNSPESQAEVFTPLLARTFVEGIDCVAKTLHCDDDDPCDLCEPLKDSSITWQIATCVSHAVPRYSWHGDRDKIGRSQLIMALLTQGMREMPVTKVDLVQSLATNWRVIRASRCILRKLGDRLWKEFEHNEATEILVAISGYEQPLHPCTANQNDGVAARLTDRASQSILGSPFERRRSVLAHTRQSGPSEDLDRNGRAVCERSGTLSRSADHLEADGPAQTLTKSALTVLTLSL